MPVPKPMPSRIASGVFGMDDHAMPVRPSADEVRAITERHAEKFAGLFEQLETVGHSIRLSCRSSADRPRPGR